MLPGNIALIDSRGGDDTGAADFERVYKVHDAARVHTVRVRRSPQTPYEHIIENLVAGRWHTLSTGDNDHLTIPFEDAIVRAAKILA